MIFLRKSWTPKICHTRKLSKKFLTRLTFSGSPKKFIYFNFFLQIFKRPRHNVYKKIKIFWKIWVYNKNKFIHQKKSSKGKEWEIKNLYKIFFGRFELLITCILFYYTFNCGIFDIYQQKFFGGIFGGS